MNLHRSCRICKLPDKKKADLIKPCACNSLSSMIHQSCFQKSPFRRCTNCGVRIEVIRYHETKETKHPGYILLLKTFIKFFIQDNLYLLKIILLTASLPVIGFFSKIVPVACFYWIYGVMENKMSDVNLRIVEIVKFWWLNGMWKSTCYEIKYIVPTLGIYLLLKLTQKLQNRIDKILFYIPTVTENGIKLDSNYLKVLEGNKRCYSKQLKRRIWFYIQLLNFPNDMLKYLDAYTLKNIETLMSYWAINELDNKTINLLRSYVVQFNRGIMTENMLFNEIPVKIAEAVSAQHNVSSGNLVDQSANCEYHDFGKSFAELDLWLTIREIVHDSCNEIFTNSCGGLFFTIIPAVFHFIIEDRYNILLTWVSFTFLLVLLPELAGRIIWRCLKFISLALIQGSSKESFIRSICSNLYEYIDNREPELSGSQFAINAAPVFLIYGYLIFSHRSHITHSWINSFVGPFDKEQRIVQLMYTAFPVTVFILITPFLTGIGSVAALNYLVVLMNGKIFIPYKSIITWITGAVSLYLTSSVFAAQRSVLRSKWHKTLLAPYEKHFLTVFELLYAPGQALYKIIVRTILFVIITRIVLLVSTATVFGMVQTFFVPTVKLWESIISKLSIVMISFSAYVNLVYHSMDSMNTQSWFTDLVYAQFKEVNVITSLLDIRKPELGLNSHTQFLTEEGLLYKAKIMLQDMKNRDKGQFFLLKTDEFNQTTKVPIKIVQKLQSSDQLVTTEYVDVIFERKNFSFLMVLSFAIYGFMFCYMLLIFVLLVFGPVYSLGSDAYLNQMNEFGIERLKQEFKYILCTVSFEYLYLQQGKYLHSVLNDMTTTELTKSLLDMSVRMIQIFRIYSTLRIMTFATHALFQSYSFNQSDFTLTIVPLNASSIHLLYVSIVLAVCLLPGLFIKSQGVQAYISYTAYSARTFWPRLVLEALTIRVLFDAWQAKSFAIGFIAIAFGLISSKHVIKEVQQTWKDSFTYHLDCQILEKMIVQTYERKNN